MPESFSKKLQNAFESKGHLCVGIDPHSWLLSECGFNDDVSGLEQFSFQLLDGISESVGFVKPQVSFFERYGAKGFGVLEKLLAEASQRDLVVIADAKRGDIGSTMDAYTAAWLGKSAPFVCDALTVSPYLGFGTLHSSIAEAAERGKAIFVLCATSNPEGPEIQKARGAYVSTSVSIAQKAMKANQVSSSSNSKFGNVGLVIGATVKDPELNETLASQNERLRAPILAPGFGTQGVSLGSFRSTFGALSDDVICSVSREALSQGLAHVDAWVSQAQEQLRS